MVLGVEDEVLEWLCGLIGLILSVCDVWKLVVSVLVEVMY